MAAAKPAEEAKSVSFAPQDNQSQPKSILKPPSQPVQEYGSQPPSLSGVSGAPQSYTEKLEKAFPASRNATDPTNRQVRETFFLMKDFGYDDFEKNNTVISQFKAQGKLDNMMGIQQALEVSYNAGGRNSVS